MIVEFYKKYTVAVKNNQYWNLKNIFNPIIPNHKIIIVVYPNDTFVSWLNVIVEQTRNLMQ